MRRQMVWDYLLANPCVDCNEARPELLDFDHIKGDKVDKISSLVNKNVSLERLKTEIEKTVVRCTACHRLKTAAEQGYYNGIVKAGIDIGWKKYLGDLDDNKRNRLN